jgi:DNA-binding NtrC family response regulator
MFAKYSLSGTTALSSNRQMPIGQRVSGTSMAKTILIVDDDPAQTRLISAVVERDGHRVMTAGGGNEAIATLEGARAGEIDLVVLDLVMPETDGWAVMERVHPARPELPFIVLTGHGGIDTVVKAMQAGARDFVVKPASPERLQVSIANALKLEALGKEITRLKKHSTGQLTFDDLIAESPAMRKVGKIGERAAQSNIPILIEGESGVGKEMIARAIQGSSDRAGRPFVTVNCGAIPENLVESILFGHEKGAFTGATDKHAGKFQEAHGGTLFLDEIGELPLDMQVKLLRALQEGEVDPVGAKKPVKVDIRLISATNRDLIQAVQDGTFREDLYYRLNVFPVAVPPLRERREDVAPLSDHFIARFAAEEGKPIRGMDADARALLEGFAWPGNVRQLENAVFRAVVLCDTDMLCFEDFPQIASLAGAQARPKPRLPDIQPAVLGAAMPAAAPQSQAAFAAAPSYADEPAYEGLPSDITALDESGNLKKLEDMEADMIRLAIEKYEGHMSEVARRLGIGRSTLYRKVRDLGIEVRA